MSSLLDHLDNNYSDGDEDDHINRLFPKCKPRASSLQPYPCTNDDSLSSESRASLSDCHLSNSKNINSVNNNNNIVCESNNTRPGTHGDVSKTPGAGKTTSSTSCRNGLVSDPFSANSLSVGGPLKGVPSPFFAKKNSNIINSRCSHNSSNHSLNSATKPKGKAERNSRTRRNHHHHHHYDQHHHQPHQSSNSVELVQAGKIPVGLISSSKSQGLGGKRNSVSSDGRGVMECDTLDDHFDNGIGSGGSGSSAGSNGSAFSQSSSLSSGGEKTNVLSMSSSGLGSSGGNVGLRDSRIEIAGGREIFSQNRIKAGRRVRGSSSMDSMIAPQALESAASLPGMTTSSSQSQLQQSKGRRKLTNSTANPLISPSSPVNVTSIWEPHPLSASRKNFPFSSSSSSSSRGGGERDRGIPYGISPSNASNALSRHSVTTSTGQSAGNASYLRSARSCHAQSQQYYSRSDFSPDPRKSPSLEGIDIGSGKAILPQVHSSSSSSSLKSPSSSALVMKETVFASEITSIEKPLEGAGKKEVKPFIYETPIDGRGEIVFDDIEEHKWRGVDGKAGDNEDSFPSTVPSGGKGQLNFLTTLMRDGEDEEEQLQPPQQQSKGGKSPFYHHLYHQQQQAQPHQHQQPAAHSLQGGNSKIMSNAPLHGSSLGNPSGYDSDECASNSVLASNLRASPNNGNKRLIGSIPIAEYEGSPKRYGLRLPSQAKPNHLELVDPNSPTIAHLSISTTNTMLSPRIQSPSSSFQQQSGGARLPGFPLRVDTSNPASVSPLPPPGVTSASKSMVNEIPGESSYPMALLMESNDPNSEVDGQLSTKLDAVTFTAGANFSVVPNNLMTTSTATNTISPAVVPVTSSVAPSSSSFPTSGSSTGGTVGSSSTVALKTTSTTTADISSDDSVASQQGSNNTTTNSSEDAEVELSARRFDVTDSRDDYLLYEFSETRKVLEEFFKPSAFGAPGGEDGRLGNFDELDYTLKRQTGNSYVGQRLAGESCNERNVEESPKKPPRRAIQLSMSTGGGGGGGTSPKLISFQEVSLPLSHNSHSQSSISPSSSMAAATAAMLLDSSRDVNDNDIDVETASTNTETDLGDTEVGLQVGHSRNFTLSPETTDCDSNELESEISLDFEASLHSSSRIGATMPVLEDGLSSGNVSDNEDRDEDEMVADRKRNTIMSCRKMNSSSGNNKNMMMMSSSSSSSNAPPTGGGGAISGTTEPNPTLLLMKKQISEIEKEIKLRSQRVVCHADSNGSNGTALATNGPGPSPLRIPDTASPNITSASVILPPSVTKEKQQQSIDRINSSGDENNFPPRDIRAESNIFDCIDPELEALDPMRPTPPPSPAPSSIPVHVQQQQQHHLSSSGQSAPSQPPNQLTAPGRTVNYTSRSNEGLNITTNNSNNINAGYSHPTAVGLSSQPNGSLPLSASAGIMVSSANTNPLGLLHDSTNMMLNEDEVLGTSPDLHQTLKDGLPKNLPSQRFDPTVTSASSFSAGATTNNSSSIPTCSSTNNKQSSVSPEDPLVPLVRDSSPVWVPRHPTSTSGNHHPHRSANAGVKDPLLRKQRYEEAPDDDADTDQETDRLLGQNRADDDYGFYDEKEKDGVKKKRSKEDLLNNPSVLIEGVLFRARYLGSTQLVCEGQPTKATRMMQAEEAVSRIKAQANQNGSVCQLSSSPPTSTEPPLPPPPPPSTKALSPYRGQAESNSYTDFVYTNHMSSSRRESEDTGHEEEDEGDSDEESIDEEDYFRRERNPVPTTLADSLVLDGVVVNSAEASLGGGEGRACLGLSSPQELSAPPSILPAFNALPGTNSVVNSLPHLSPPCGSALPGTMFRLRFVGSLEVEEEMGSGKRRRKRTKKTMVEEAVLKLKAPDGETQPSTEVDLFISTEKIMVLNTDLKEIMMDHALRTISYIADIGDLVVLMARRRPVPSDTTDESKIPRPPKMICHVFESDEAQYIAQSIGQAFQVAYMEFLKANGIEDHSFVREMDYQEVLNSQEIFGDELQMFAKKELQKEVVVPKTKGEILGVVIVESGWGSMLPTVVIANLAPAGAAARCGQLNIGDQIIAINGVSLVGLPLSTCQNYIKNTKAQTVVKLTVVPCPPVVEVKIKRPDTKYQLGFSVQNGVICSLLRGGIAERGGVRVGHRIIEINNQSVVAVPHEKIVNLLATSVGEINMKTMPTSMFRLLTGQETPLYI